MQARLRPALTAKHVRPSTFWCGLVQTSGLCSNLPILACVRPCGNSINRPSRLSLRNSPSARASPASSLLIRQTHEPDSSHVAMLARPGLLISRPYTRPRRPALISPRRLHASAHLKWARRDRRPAHESYTINFKTNSRCVTGVIPNRK